VKVGSTLSYLASDPLGSNSAGQVIALEHYSPYGTVDYSWGTMPTSYNYAGERLDSQTGLLCASRPPNLTAAVIATGFYECL
jgi:hypothetical protein